MKFNLLFSLETQREGPFVSGNYTCTTINHKICLCLRAQRIQQRMNPSSRESQKTFSSMYKVM